ncbi:S8/S53 family peptidase [Ralstonia solanacearum]|uniref:S8/S53 family peptidase n=1 Tax=Ralstonia solanacearum TaxID=305 RepID=UPI0018D1CA29|nr:S8/S53 family peptidase [Ralstonia solanacearum]
MDSKAWMLAPVCLLAASEAISASWDIAGDPLRLNLGVVTTGGDKPMEFARSDLVSTLPKLVNHKIAAQQAQLLGTTPNQAEIQWSRIDARDTPESFLATAPFCAPQKDATLVSRAAAWEVAYGCLRTLSSKQDNVGQPFLNQFIDSAPGAKLYGIEPVLDLVNVERANKEGFLSRNSTVSPDSATPASPPTQSVSAADATTRFIPASPVWPSGEPGWHLDDNHTQLGSAYRKVFPRGTEMRGEVLVAHLDTGYFPLDPVIPLYFDRGLSKTCYVSGCSEDGTAHWGAHGPLVSPGHGTATLSNFAGRPYVDANGKGPTMLGGNPSAHIYSINIHDSVIHLDSRRMAAGIVAAVEDGADLITLSHGGLPSLELASAVNYAYTSGTPIFAATGDFFDLPLFFGRTFQHVVYPARYNQVMGVAGVTRNRLSYGEDPSLAWWFSFGPGYYGRIGSWMLRGSFGPTAVMSDGNIVSAFAPNITRSSAEPSLNNIIGSNGAGTSHATPQVSAAASLWLEQNRSKFGTEWRGWQKSEAIYQALSNSVDRCFADYTIEHYGRGIVKANNALAWTYARDGNAGPALVNTAQVGATPLPLTQRLPDNVELPGVIDIIGSARLPGQFESSLREAFINSLATELAQVVFTSDELQHYLQSLNVCRPASGCDRCTRQDIDWLRLAEIVSTLDDASPTLKHELATSAQTWSKAKASTAALRGAGTTTTAGAQ